MTDQSFLDRLRGHFVPEEAYVPNPERFPRREMFILACVVLSSALSMTGLFPYVAFMTADFMHVDINKSGYYAGYVASSMMFGRLLSSVFWGRMSDRIGRKPVMYIGCSSIIIFSILFGFSVNFWMALLTRFLLGLFNPVISVARTVVSEVCAPKHQAIGMSLNIGTV
jgi:MFS family permease